MKTIQIKIDDLKKIIERAEEEITHDSSLSSTLKIDLINECDTHTGSDAVLVTVKSSYQECIGCELHN